jgi:adenosylmethionine-8-amino-7-oxononanoate aminotransferase
MAPGAIWRPKPGLSPKSSKFLPRIATAVKSSLLNRSINIAPYRVKRGAGNCYYLEDDTEIYDGSGGASVATMGKRDKRVERAMRRLQRLGLSYVPALAFDTKVTSDLADFMLKTTDNMMKKAVFYCSGTKPDHLCRSSLTLYQALKRLKQHSRS